jgi:hypothetical protein
VDVAGGVFTGADHQHAGTLHVLPTLLHGNELARRELNESRVASTCQHFYTKTVRYG